MTFTLGYAPEKFQVVVSAGSDFFSSLRRSDDTDWPSTCTLTLIYDGDTEWEATLNGASATWDIDQDEVDTLIALKPKKVRLWYVDGETRLLWASGTLVVK